MVRTWLLALALAAPPDVELVGVVVSGADGTSSAVLQSGGRARVAGVGERAFGGRVTHIEESKVLIDFGAGPVELRLARTPPPPVSSEPAQTPEARPTAQGVQMERAEVERRLAEEVPRILSETALVPVSDGGRVTGFALSRLPPNSLLTDVGLQPGDVLVEVNGVPVDSLATLASLYTRLQNETVIRAVVLRGGSRVPLVVNLR